MKLPAAFEYTNMLKGVRCKRCGTEGQLYAPVFGSSFRMAVLTFVEQHKDCKKMYDNSVQVESDKWKDS